MYAIVNIAGKQFKVTQEQKLYVPLLQSEVGSTVEFDNVMLFSDDKGITVGSPIVEGKKVTATVIEHMQDEKVLVFKKKRRKGYRKMVGHRQQFTQIEINTIS